MSTYSTNLNQGQYERTIYSILNLLGDVGGLQGIVWQIAEYFTLFFTSNFMLYYLVTGVFKIAFKFRLKDLRTCHKTKRRKALENGMQKIEDELDIVHFVRG